MDVRKNVVTTINETISNIMYQINCTILDFTLIMKNRYIIDSKVDVLKVYFYLCSLFKYNLKDKNLGLILIFLVQGLQSCKLKTLNLDIYTYGRDLFHID